MSMELFVILALNRAPNVDAWQQALHRQRISAQFREKVNLDGHDGFLPIVVKGQETGLYFHKDSYSEPQAGVFMNSQALTEAGDLCLRSATMTDADSSPATPRAYSVE